MSNGDDRDTELGRKIAAAIAYSGKDQKTIVAATGISDRTLSRWINTGVPDRRPHRALGHIAQACGLTLAWFAADFEQLGFIEATGPADAFRRAAELQAARPQDTNRERRTAAPRRQGDRDSRG